LRGAAAACVFLRRFSSVASVFFLPTLQKKYRDEAFVIESFDEIT